MPERRWWFGRAASAVTPLLVFPGPTRFCSFRRRNAQKDLHSEGEPASLALRHRFRSRTVWTNPRICEAHSVATSSASLLLRRAGAGALDGPAK